MSDDDPEREKPPDPVPAEAPVDAPAPDAPAPSSPQMEAAPIEGRPVEEPPASDLEPPSLSPPDASPLEPSLDPPAPPLVQAPLPKRRFRWGRLLLLLLLTAILWPPVSVLVTKVVLPPATFLMLERMFQGRGLEKHYRPLDQIAPSLATAVIAAEDAKFCEHDGFDWDAIRTAAEHNARSPSKVRGGSTLSQQTAKNVFLWPARDYVRKGLEAGYTILIEKLWGKRRILEAYLNVVEWGPGLYGAQAAAQRYFHVDASALTPQQSARLAAILPSPLKWKAVNPGRYVARRCRRIGANAAIVREDDLAWCVRR